MATTQARGYAFALAAAALVGFTPVASKLVLAELPVTTFGTLWFGCAGLYATLALALRGRHRLLVLSGRVLVMAGGVGVCNGVAGLMFFRAIQTTDPALVAFYTRPGTLITVLAGMVFFRERLVKSEWLAVLLIMAGAAVLGFGASSGELGALALVIGSVVATTASYALAKGAVVGSDPLVVVVYRGVFSSLTFLAAAAITGTWSTTLSRNAWALPVGAFIGPFLSFVFLFSAFRHLPLGRASAVHAANPLFAVVYVKLVFGNQLSPREWLGGLLATLGVVLMVAQGRRTPPDTVTKLETGR